MENEPIFKKEDSVESAPEPRDISEEFANMDTFDFLDLLRKLKNEPILSIVADWKDVATARRLKAFLDTARGQKRTATIKATEEQHEEEPNVFASGVKWEKV